MPLMRKCSVRWYSSSSLRYWEHQCRGRLAKRLIDWRAAYCVETLDVRNVLLNHQLHFLWELTLRTATAATRASGK